MKMSMENAVKALDAINEKTKGLQCPMCQSRMFDLAPVELQIIGYDREKNDLNISFGDRVDFVSVISATCKNCGYTALFNLKKLGIIESEFNKSNNK